MHIPVTQILQGRQLKPWEVQQLALYDPALWQLNWNWNIRWVNSRISPLFCAPLPVVMVTWKVYRRDGPQGTRRKVDGTGIIYNLLRKADSWDNDIMFTTAAHFFKTNIRGVLWHTEEEKMGDLSNVISYFSVTLLRNTKADNMHIKKLLFFFAGHGNTCL